MALEASSKHRVWLAGRHPGHLPFRVEGFLGRFFLTGLMLRVVFHRVLTVKTPLGRKVREKILGRGGPLIRVKPGSLMQALVECTPRMLGVRDGLPVLEDGRTLRVKNVIWCTGFRPAFNWIDLPIFEPSDELRHEAGVVQEAAGLYFVGLHFLYAISSAMIHGIGRDAARIAEAAMAHRKGAVSPGVWRLPNVTASDPRVL